MVSEATIISRVGQEHPNLVPGSFAHTSDETVDYNCIAWAAGDDEKAWWPGHLYWPTNRVDETPENFVQAFKTLGFKLGKGFGDPKNVERLAFYAINGVPTHAARQLESGEWTSKLGKMWDISHELGALEGGIYGQVAFYMHRKRAKK
jgi:hypothetical protein